MDRTQPDSLSLLHGVWGLSWKHSKTEGLNGWGLKSSGQAWCWLWARAAAGAGHTCACGRRVTWTSSPNGSSGSSDSRVAVCPQTGCPRNSVQAASRHLCDLPWKSDSLASSTVKSVTKACPEPRRGDVDPTTQQEQWQRKCTRVKTTTQLVHGRETGSKMRMVVMMVTAGMY